MVISYTGFRMMWYTVCIVVLGDTTFQWRIKGVQMHPPWWLVMYFMGCRLCQNPTFNEDMILAGYLEKRM